MKNKGQLKYLYIAYSKMSLNDFRELFCVQGLRGFFIETFADFANKDFESFVAAYLAIIPRQEGEVIPSSIWEEKNVSKMVDFLFDKLEFKKDIDEHVDFLNELQKWQDDLLYEAMTDDDK